MPSRADDHPLEALVEGLRRRRRLGLSVFVLTAAAGATAAFSLPSLYSSRATILVEQGKADAGGSADLESRLQLISQELLSRSGLEPLIRRFDLYRSLQPAPVDFLVQQMRSDIHTESKLQARPSGVGSTVAFTVGYRGGDPRTVAKVANALAAAYIERDLRIRERQAAGTLKILGSQLNEVKANLQQQERARAEFQDQHRGELTQQTEANMANLARLQADLRTAIDDRIRAVDRRNALLRELTEAETGAGPASAGGPLTPEARLAKAKEELAQLRQRYSDKYPDVVRLEDEVAALESRAVSGSRAPADGAAPPRSAGRLREAAAEMEAEIEAHKAEEARLRTEIAERIRRLESAPQTQRDYEAIARDHQTTRDLYDSLRKRYDQAQLEEEPEGDRMTTPLRILDPAMVPQSPIAPHRPTLLLVSLLGALATAVAAMALIDRLDASMHSPADVQSFTRVPVVASIPRILTAKDLRAGRRRAWLLGVALLAGVAVVVHTVHDAAAANEDLVARLARGRS